MLSYVQSYLLQGIDAHRCEIEVDFNPVGLEKTDIVGLPDTAVRESLERVTAAISNAGYPTLIGRLVINLAPADLRKEGPVYDLPIAVGQLVAAGVIRPDLGRGREAVDHRQCLIAGELALDGRIRPIRGAIAMSMLARELGLPRVILPAANALEAAVVEGVEVLGMRTLQDVVALLNGQLDPEPTPAVDVESLIEHTLAPIDFAEVRGQEGVKRAITVAAAGSHNIAMLGPAGTGKSMMAKALPGILPPLTPDEALEVTRIYSAAGMLCHANGASNGSGHAHSGLITSRPVRTPHHTASSPALIGGGQVPRPGEISLAHRGVLFLDELPEFPRVVLETLRQPLEDGAVTIARAHAAVRFPTAFMLVTAMNPTQRGGMPEDEVGRREMDRYLSRISRPLIDRIDIHVEAPAVPWKELSASSATGTSSAQMRERVLLAHTRARARQGRVHNAHLSGRALDELAPMKPEAKELLGQAIATLGLSARAYDKVRRVARSIADLEDSDELTCAHVAEAVQYRLLDRQI
ncbi:MAG: YifB family Mg chelatase-like AAA ATPase [Phycisphaeraceae bacterium]|nr:YifB family Mg chelatase-like AAA ATPase [Phycisphaeraceae bacterium]